jgi:hypothetical protein
MNTVGKTLVILNLIFALLTGGFLVIDFATRTNWKNAYEQQQRELLVASGNVNATNKITATQVTEASRAIAKVEELKQQLAGAEEEYKAKLNEAALEKDLATNKIKEFELVAEKFKLENVALKDEVKALVATIAKREQYIAGVQEESRKLRTEAINSETKAKSMQDRNESLLSQYQAALAKLAKAEAGGGAEPGQVRDPNQANPPPTKVTGKIKTVDSENKGLVTITIGSDDGLQRNHTLEVYRMTPTPQYLGMIRIVETEHHQAIGRLMPSSVAGARGQLREGDIVASSLGVQ